MNLFEVRNVHAALPLLLADIERFGEKRESRNGSVLVFPEPVTIQYQKPTERVVFWPERDANPWFHLFEFLWMLQGRQDLDFLARFVPRMKDFSDNGRIFHAAYGYRWRDAFGKDQLNYVIKGLKADPNSRRQVIQIWDAGMDLGKDSKDLPCNLVLTVQIGTKGQLDMVVFNRSNDAILGALGANAVHFSFLQEYLASCIGVPVGRYWQVSANMHVYLGDTYIKCKPIALAEPDILRRVSYNPYVGHVAPFPLLAVGESQEKFEDDLYIFFKDGSQGEYSTAFFKGVAKPMLKLHEEYKDVTKWLKEPANGESFLDIAKRWEVVDILIRQVQASDWRVAAQEWIYRRRK